MAAAPVLLKLECKFDEDRKKSYIHLKVCVNQNGLGDVGLVFVEDIKGKEDVQFMQLARQLVCHLNDGVVWRVGGAGGNANYHIVSLQVPNDGRDYVPFLRLLLSTGEMIRCSESMVYIREPLKDAPFTLTQAAQPHADDDPDRPVRQMTQQTRQGVVGTGANRFAETTDQATGPPKLIPMFLPMTMGVDARALAKPRVQFSQRGGGDEEEEEEEDQRAKEREGLRRRPIAAHNNLPPARRLSTVDPN